MTGGNGDTTSVYEQKFSEFLKVCQKANPSGKDVLIVDHPEALGDDYGELVESLNRLGNAGLNLAIVPRKDRP